METYERVSRLLKQSLEEFVPPQNTGPQNGHDSKVSHAMPPTSHTLLDLVVTLSIYLPRSTFASLFALAERLIQIQTDPQLQKKAYKLIPRLSSSSIGAEALKEHSPELQRLLLNNSNTTSTPARRDRLTAINTVIDHLPQEDLYFIPAVLSEAVMACKEVNEKARTAAFDLLVLMAHKMSDGGTVQQSRIPHMDASALEVPASLEEFFTMVAAGLAGTTPHMISASITALTRISYEFVDGLAQSAMSDLVQTMAVFLTSKNREIVRSVLGFVKVAIVSLPESMIRPLLGALIPGVLSWSHEHKDKFRLKVKKLLERAIKRFGYEDVERHCPEEDKKLIQHIRKERERRKKKRKDGSKTDGNDQDTGKKHKPEFQSAYDRALYGSESGSGSESDSDNVVQQHRLGKNDSKGTYITENPDEPLDLLSRKTLANVSSSKPQPPRKPQALSQKSKTNTEGKMIFDENGELVGGDYDDTDNDEEMGLDADGIGGIDAYTEAISGKDAVQRGQRGRLKYNNRKTHGDEMDLDEKQDHGPQRENIEKKVRFEAPDVNAHKHKGGSGPRRRESKGAAQKSKGGISKRVHRKPLGGGKINSGRIGKS